MVLYSYLMLFALSVLLFSAYVVVKKKFACSFKGVEKNILKVLALILAAVFAVRYIAGNEALKTVIGLNGSPLASPFLTFISGLAIWFSITLAVLFILYPFFRNKMTTAIVKFVAPILIIFNVIAMGQMIFGVVGSGADVNFDIRTLLIPIELVIEIFVCAFVWFSTYNQKYQKNIKSALLYVLGVLGMLLITMPAYIPQLYFGYINLTVEIDGISLWHRIYIYIGIIIPFAVYFALRNKDEQTKRFVLLFMSLGGLITFMCDAKYMTWLDVCSWPIHLCHTAMYIIPLCLIFKWNKLFYFTFFINVLGAFLAMAMPNTTGNMLEYGVIHFWINHHMAFYMPLLVVALKLYEKPHLKQFVYSAVAFTIYYVLILVINAWFSNYGTCDFFFTNSDFIADKLGTWAENLRNVTIAFSLGNLSFVFYPLYQIPFYLVYILMSLGMWFLYEQVYNYTDMLTELKQKRKKYKLEEIALMSKLNGREINSPVDIENEDKLVLKGFTKRYGKSHVYAVKDADLEVHAGEIFGFLGPNGAGKSTIIKSIVGIQPITSGSIHVCGYDVDSQPIEAKRNIGFVPDHYALYEKLTGREYINYIADIYEVSQEDRTNRIEHYVKIFQLENAFDNQMKTYSHGMKQKIAIMSALVHNPKLWILDEPLTGLDPNSIYQVKECMKEHARNGNIVFFSSHIIDVVERICDRIGIIKKGQIQLVKEVKEILDSGEALEDFYMNTIENSNCEEIKVDRELIDHEKQNKKVTSKEQRLQLKQEIRERKELKRKQKQEKKIEKQNKNSESDGK